VRVIELSWRAGLDEALAAEVRALADAAAAADGTPPLGEHVLMHLTDAGPAHLLALDGGALRGVAQLAAADGADHRTAELVVHPEHRRAGLGRRIVEEVLARAGGTLDVWAHGQHPGAVALAARMGFTAVRELWQMRRSLLDPLPEPEFPAGVRVRAFVPGQDDEEFLRVNNAAFSWHPEQGGWDRTQLQLREAEPWFDPAGFLLAVDSDDRLLGFHWTKVHTAPEPIGEVYVLGVDPSARGLRLGAALTLAGLHHLRERGQTRVLLYVEADNAPAVKLYGGLGFTRWQADVSYRR
jgi:mycothiol synthase